MACGLGAAVLILILLKLQPEDTPIDLDDLKVDLMLRQEQEGELKALIGQQKNEEAKIEAEISTLAGETRALEEEVAATEETTREKIAELDSLKERILKSPPAQKADVVQSDQGGEEEYLLGLKVEGRRIAFLIDTSASMTDENLIDIIKRKSGSDQDKMNGPKWKRTQRIVKWLANRIPKASEAVFIGFNETAFAIGPSVWFRGSDASSIQHVFSSIDRVVPTNATNLEAALQAAKHKSDLPTNYYVVTDGLPTEGDSNYGSLNPFAGCTSLFGKSSIITGECRRKLFEFTVRNYGVQAGVPVNVILLPLEGDPGAAPSYWSWTFATGGLLISPAENWP